MLLLEKPSSSLHFLCLEMAFAYDLDEHGFLKTAFRCSNTIWPMILTAPGFWLFFVLHMLLWACYNYRFWGFTGLGTGNLSLQWDDLQVISGLTTFFEVFYTNQSYTAYFALNRAINQTFRSSHRLTYDIKLYTSSAGPRYTWMATRFMRLSLVLFHVELRHGPASDDQWQKLLDVGLVTEEECWYLREMPSSQRSMVLLNWIGRVITLAYERSSLNHGPYLRRMLELLTEFDEAQKQVLDIVRMPVPFQYYHLLNVMVGINVVLWAYGMALSDSVFGPVCYFFASAIFIGMLELAKQLSDPFGNDDVDFPIHIWIEKYLENSAAFVASQYPGGAIHLENQMEREVTTHFDPDAVGAMYLAKDEKINNVGLVGRVKSVARNRQRTQTDSSLRLQSKHSAFSADTQHVEKERKGFRTSTAYSMIDDDLPAAQIQSIGPDDLFFDESV